MRTQRSLSAFVSKMISFFSSSNLSNNAGNFSSSANKIFSFASSSSSMRLKNKSPTLISEPAIRRKIWSLMSVFLLDAVSWKALTNPSYRLPFLASFLKYSIAFTACSSVQWNISCGISVSKPLFMSSMCPSIALKCSSKLLILLSVEMISPSNKKFPRYLIMWANAI